MDTQRARFQANYSRSYQFNDDLTWIKGKHTLRFGFEFRPIWFRHDRADKVVGSISSLVATVDQGSFLTIPGNQYATGLRHRDVGELHHVRAT